MSHKKELKAKKAAARAEREAREGRKVVNYVVASLIILMVLGLSCYYFIGCLLKLKGNSWSRASSVTKLIIAHIYGRAISVRGTDGLSVCESVMIRAI